MRKMTKLISIIAILVMLVGVCSGCVKSDVMTTLYFGVPFEEGSDQWEELSYAVEDINMFKEVDFIRFELVTVPEDKKEREEFLKDMDQGKIALFMYDRDELVDKYLESGRIATLSEIQQVYPACYENAKQYMLDTSTDNDGMNHMLALAGHYQGVFFNEDIFDEYQLDIPKTWEQFNTTIETLKQNGVTPIAAGFSDNDGLARWMDELILMEGGVAEHSYVPKYGVVNSWSRAMDNIKNLADSKAFNDDYMSATHEQAVELFNNGDAAMIVATSKQVVPGADLDTTGVFSLPVSSTGKKNIGDIICDFDRGIYINSTYLKKRTEIIDSIIEMVIEYLNANAEDYGDEPEKVSWSYPAYSEDWMIPANPYTIGIEEVIYNEYGDIIEDDSDPSIPEKIGTDNGLEEYTFNMLENITLAGRSLTTKFSTIDYFVEQIRDYLKTGGDAEKRESILLDVTDKEAEAQKGETSKE